MAKRSDKSTVQLDWPLLYVEWEDAGVASGDGWTDAAEVLSGALKSQDYVNVTVGWLIGEENGVVVLAAQIAPSACPGRGHSHDVDLAQRIPISLIRYREVLKVAQTVSLRRKKH